MICDNLNKIRQKIQETALSVNRDPDSVRLVAVSKFQAVESIREAFDCGQIIFGENYLQEAQRKINTLDISPVFHFIGHLQSNKAKIAAELFRMIETVDRLSIAQSLNKHAFLANRILDILVQVNIGEENQKSGVSPRATSELLTQISKLPSLRIRGLMAMPPFTEDPEESRPYFRKLKELSDELAAERLFANPDKVELSMGMSNDFHVAIEEGATLVRVGTAIFGSRS